MKTFSTFEEKQMRKILLFISLILHNLINYAQPIELGGDIQFRKLNDSSLYDLNFELNLRVYRIENQINSLPDTAYVCINASCPSQSQILILHKVIPPHAHSNGGFFDSSMHYCPTFDSIPHVITHLYTGKIYLDTSCTLVHFTYISKYQRFSADNTTTGDSSHIKVSASMRPHLFNLENKGIQISPAPFSFCINRKQRYILRNNNLHDFDSTKFHWNQPTDNQLTDSCTANGVGLLYATGFSSNNPFPTLNSIQIEKDMLRFNSTSQKGAFRYLASYQDVQLYGNEFSGWFVMNSMQREGVVFFVEGCAPNADFKFNYLQLGDTTRVRFVADTTDPVKSTTFFWDFGNGRSDTGKVVENWFTVSNDYPVKLKVCNDCGCDSIVIPLPVSRLNISEIEQNELIVFPNPNKGIFTIKGFKSYEKNIEISMYDLSGNIVHNRNIDINNGNVSIDAKHLPNGSYILILKSNHNLQFKRILIQHGSL